MFTDLKILYFQADLVRAIREKLNGGLIEQIPAGNRIMQASLCFIALRPRAPLLAPRPVPRSEFTAADIMMNFPFGMLTKFAQYDLSPYPNINAHLARIAARPAYQKAMALADPPA